VSHDNVRTGWLLFALGVGIVAAVAGHDLFVLGLHPWREGVPEWSAGNVARSLAYLAASMCVVAALFRHGTASTAPTAGIPAAPLRAASSPVRVGVAVVALLGLAFALLIACAPVRFVSLAQEDSVVENASALFALLAAASAWTLARRLHRDPHRPRLEVAAVAALGGVCFLIAGEEVSWFQRVFDWHPSFAQANQQAETNLHNFATGTFENAYYFFAGYVVLVVLPAARAAGSPLGRLAPLASLFPSPWLIGVGALISAFNYDMVMGVPTQIAFWGSLCVLAALAWSCRDDGMRRQALIWLLLALSVQATFLAFGHRSANIWDVTEYKEMLIPAALWLWSVDLWGLTQATDTRPGVVLDAASPGTRSS
jgi:hypothetical protein